MTFFPFNDTVPFATNNPSADQTPMLKNNQSNMGIWEVDHFGFNDNSGGYHAIIHQPNQTINGQAVWNPDTSSGVPGAIGATKIANVQQIFAMNYTPDSTVTSTDTQLFTMTGKGGISQLSGNLSGDDGWVWSGGILYQWGKITGLSGAWPAGGNVNITFKDRVPGAIPFPNFCFNVQLTMIGSSTQGFQIGITAKAKTGFTAQIPPGNTNNNCDGFYWMAIGN